MCCGAASVLLCTAAASMDRQEQPAQLSWGWGVGGGMSIAIKQTFEDTRQELSCDS